MIATKTFLARALATVGVLAATATPLLAGSFFSDEVGADPAKIADKVKYHCIPKFGRGAESGIGPSPYLPALGAPPKRIALVTFYAKDSGHARVHPYQGWSTHQNVTVEGIDYIADEIYKASIASLKDGFKEHGTELLTPEEFLDTQEKKDAYAAFKLEMGAGAHVMKFLTHMDKDSTMLEGAPEGYRLLSFATNNDAKGNNFELAANDDAKVFNGLGHDLAQSLGVDAVAIMYSIVQDETKSIEMLGSYLYVFGPNPVKRDDKPSFYYLGHNYVGVTIRYKATLVKVTKQKETDNDFAGFGPVAKAMAIKAGEYLEEKTKKEK